MIDLLIYWVIGVIAVNAAIDWLDVSLIDVEYTVIYLIFKWIAGRLTVVNE